MCSVHADAEHQAPIDLRHLQETSEGDRAFEKELFSLYMSDCSDGLSRLTLAQEAGEHETVRHEAHAISGASGNVGAKQLRLLSSALEKAAEQKTDSQALVQAVAKEWKRVQTFIQEYLQTI